MQAFNASTGKLLVMKAALFCDNIFDNINSKYCNDLKCIVTCCVFVWADWLLLNCFLFLTYSSLASNSSSSLIQEEACQKKPKKCASSDEAVDVEENVVEITNRNADTRAGYSVSYLLIIV